ncbi:galactose-3-O-sulfotransferase 2-like [Saccoglossus kowalevskii]|uniref:Galactose-3-O-sulfotransferase 2-like n=1 Tax=Saccoglossus kowalevskii TaxID=10224 RepID=A0ABM0GWN7_SACKO|nr:PREDICTED: galactose-3-O-sulfotransferase 2-like [Saccoglossus kowalevskii]
MHKCGSSTILNILLRYADKYNLTVAMPPKGNYLGWPHHFKKEMVIQVPWNEYNIFTHHSRFEYESIKAMMPNDTVFVAALREPVTMFESVFTYYNLGTQFGLNGSDSLDRFISNPHTYHKTTNARAWNPMLFDLGISSMLMKNTTFIESQIDWLTNVFDLVLISEYMDESLILLKDLMCWDIDDIVALSMNARVEDSKRNISEDIAEKIRQWNSGDVSLYRTFNQTFWKRIEDFGSARLQIELDKLKVRRQELFDECIDNVVSNDSRVWHPSHVNVKSFRLKPGATINTICLGLTRTELPFTIYMRDNLLTRIRTFNSDNLNLIND